MPITPAAMPQHGVTTSRKEGSDDDRRDAAATSPPATTDATTASHATGRRLPRSQISLVSPRSFVIVLSRSQPVSYHSRGRSRWSQFYIMHDATPSHPTAPISSASSASSRTLAGIAALLVAYAAAAAFGWPQYGRDLLVQAQATPHAAHEPAAHDGAHAADAGDAVGISTSPPILTVLPFALLPVLAVQTRLSATLAIPLLALPMAAATGSPNKVDTTLDTAVARGARFVLEVPVAPRAGRDE
jgi:hypothetical protein